MGGTLARTLGVTTGLSELDELDELEGDDELDEMGVEWSLSDSSSSSLLLWDNQASIKPAIFACFCFLVGF